MEVNSKNDLSRDLKKIIGLSPRAYTEVNDTDFKRTYIVNFSMSTEEQK